MKAVMVTPETPCFEGLCGKDGKPLKQEEPERLPEEPRGGTEEQRKKEE